MTEGFHDAHGRSYIGSRDIDVGLHVDPQWSADDIGKSPLAETLEKIESKLGYSRGRFGFYQQFHRDSGDRLDDEAARELPAHEIFRVDIDVIPDTSALDAFEVAFGFRPPAEPLLEAVFEDDAGDHLGEYVDWEVPRGVQIASPGALAAMKVRAFPNRDRSHKRLKDIADLHALLWYVSDYDDVKDEVLSRVSDNDLHGFESAVDPELYERTARLIDVDESLLGQSIQRLLH